MRLFFSFSFFFLSYKSDQGEENYEAFCLIMHHVTGLIISVGLEREIPRYMYASDNYEKIAMKHDDKTEEKMSSKQNCGINLK